MSDTKEKLQEISDRGYIQDIEDENERRLQRGEEPIDVERTKVWYYIISDKSKDERTAWDTAETLLKMLKEKTWPIDREHVSKAMMLLDGEIK